MSWYALAQHDSETDVLGDINHWATAYLDSGLHLEDWEQRMQTQLARFATFLQSPPGFMPPPALPLPPEDVS